MEKLGLNEIRAKFQAFYESKGHYSRGSFPLIPQGDKSLLIINSGMAPMKPYFAGIKEPPSRRMTTCQKCIRTADIENVGITSRHGTFFEMLGSFSFGDYFKRESITWGWEFLTDVLHMDPSRLWVTVYEKDEEACGIWRDIVGFPEERIVRLGKEDNFWEIGSGPCGPCSEIYFDRGASFGCGKPDCKPGCDCDRFIEFWNHVFTQFNHDGEGHYTELTQKNIDTGMGLERLACILQGVDSIFDVDTIASILQEVVHATGCPYEDGKAASDVSIRIITDHIRSATFMISDHILPGNEGRGYVLRRLIRRAIRHGRQLGAKKGFLSGLVDAVVRVSQTAYPELKEQQTFITKIVAAEEEQFDQTLDQGMARIQEYIQSMKEKDEETLDGRSAFQLHDTYGFPIDITEEILADAGFRVDRHGFEAAMQEQKERGKSDAAKTDAAWEDSPIAHIEGKTIFTGYEKTEDTAVVRAVLADPEEEDLLIVLDRTPFYAEGGGQASDCGWMEAEQFRGTVLEVTRYNDHFVHRVHVQEGFCKEGDTLLCRVNCLMRNHSARNHTATHLLHRALRQVLGEHVAQAGSSVDAYGLRFDFSHFEALTQKQLQQVADLVNQKIESFIPVTTEEMPREQAESAGATGLFEEKYGAVVRVVSIGNYSKELCGGIHVGNTGQIGAFQIRSESGVASGVRRIEAITGRAILEHLNKAEQILDAAGSLFKTNRDMLVEKLEKVSAEHKEVRRELEELKKEAMDSVSDQMIKNAREINGIRVLTHTFQDVQIGELRTLSDEIKAKQNNVAMIFAAVNDGKVTFLVSLTDDVVSRGYHAGKMIKQIAAAAGGGGGGKADMAQAGAKDVSRIPAAFETAEKLLE